MRTRSPVSVRMIGFLLVTFLGGSAAAGPGDTTLVSRQSDADGGAPANLDATDASVSGDGRFVAFTSAATNLGPTVTGYCDNTFGTISNVWVRDRLLGTTTLVSRADGPDGTPGNGCSRSPSISADGRYVAFDSEAQNLSPDDADNYRSDVYVRDLHANTTRLASRVSGALGDVGDGPSTGASVSDDGRYVSFGSNASNLSPDDVTLTLDGQDYDAYVDVFVRDFATNETILVSRKSGANGDAQNGRAWKSELSGEGRHVVWRSEAENLSDEDVNAPFRSTELTANTFVRDLDANTTVFVNRATGAHGAASESSSYSPTISPDGRYVAFGSYADNISDDDYDNPDNGMWRGEYGDDGDVFLRDIVADTTILISRETGPNGLGAQPCFATVPPDGAGDRPSTRPAVSNGGRFVAFVSCSDNLSAADDDTVDNVFVRDTVLDTTALVSRASGIVGAGGNADAEEPAISDDGLVVAFQSTATNLADAGPSGTTQVFAREITVPPPVDVLLGGYGLALRDDQVRGSKRSVKLSSKDGQIVPSASIAAGATLRIVGASFDATYQVPASGWTISAGGGLRYRDAHLAHGPVRTVDLSAGKLRIGAKGAGLTQPLAVDPEPVAVVLTTAETRYCLAFGGAVSFHAGKAFSAHGSPAPEACPN